MAYIVYKDICLKKNIEQTKMESGIKNKYSHAGQIYMILFLSLFLHRPWYPLIPYAGSTLAPCQNTLRKQAAHISSPQGTHQPAGSLNQRRGHPKKIGPQQISSTNVTMFLTLLWPCQPISFTTTSFDVLSNPVDSPKKFTGWQLPGKMNASEPHSYPIHCHKLVKPPMFRYQGHVPILGFHSNRPFTPSSLRLSFTVSKRFWWPTWSKGGGWLMFFLVGESSIDRSCP